MSTVHVMPLGHPALGQLGHQPRPHPGEEHLAGSGAAVVGAVAEEDLLGQRDEGSLCVDVLPAAVDDNCPVPATESRAVHPGLLPLLPTLLPSLDGLGGG